LRKEAESYRSGSGVSNLHAATKAPPDALVPTSCEGCHPNAMISPPGC